MARYRPDSETARITPFARERLERLVDTLATTAPPMAVSEWELVGALIHAAGRSPKEAVKAIVETYRTIELEARAVEVVILFLRAHADE